MLRSSYWKLKNKAIININSNDVTEFETLQHTATQGNPVDFYNNYRCKLNIPFQFSRNAKIVIDGFKFKGALKTTTIWPVPAQGAQPPFPTVEDNYNLYNLRLYTPSISVKNQFSTNNKGDLDILTAHFISQDNSDTYVYHDGAAEVVTTRDRDALMYEFKNDDLDMNSLDLRSTDFTNNEVVISFNTRYIYTTGNANTELNNLGLVNGTEWSLRMIVYDYDEDTVNYASGEADIKRNINAVPNTGIDKLLMPSITL